MTVHPEHGEIVREVERWFTTPNLQMGYEVVATWFGYVATFGGSATRVILTIDDPLLVERALGETSVERRRPLTVWVDDPTRAPRLDKALRAYGCTKNVATEHLALVGDLRVASELGDLETARVTDAQRIAWATTKLMCFNNSEAVPSPVALTAELATRESERAVAESWFAVLDVEPVGILAFYTGNDRAAYLLGTRVSFRRRGVAQTLLARWVRDGLTAGCRSHLINATVGGGPAAMYRRLGFVDVVHWYQRYDLGLGSPPTFT